MSHFFRNTRVHLGGVDISRWVRSFEVMASVGSLPTVHLELVGVEVDMTDGLVSIGERPPQPPPARPVPAGGRAITVED